VPQGQRASSSSRAVCRSSDGRTTSGQRRAKAGVLVTAFLRRFWNGRGTAEGRLRKIDAVTRGSFVELPDNMSPAPRKTDRLAMQSGRLLRGRLVYGFQRHRSIDGHHRLSPFSLVRSFCSLIIHSSDWMDKAGAIAAGQVGRQPALVTLS